MAEIEAQREAGLPVGSTADDAAAQQGRAASSAELRAHLRRPAPPVPRSAAATAPPAPDPGEVLAAALRCPCALTTPDQFFTPEAHGPGSAPAAHGCYALVGQPETLVFCERMETARLLLYGQ